VARKQSEYLTGLLDEDTDKAEAGDRGAIETKSMPPRPGGGGATLLNRESALARVASGEVRQVTQLLLDPARVRIWPGNARVYSDLTEQGCRDLIDSIIAEGGQKVPAVVRRVTDDPNHEFEVIAGTRRHFAISWLRANNYPDMRYLAQVAILDDEAAFRLADLENRARTDVSDIERARNYAAALRQHYGGHQTRMAERLKLSKGWLSKMLKVAALPNTIINAYGAPGDIALASAYRIAQALEDDRRRSAITGEAGSLEIEQRRHRRRGEPAVSSAEVTRRLLAAPRAGEGGAEPVLYSWDSKTGRPGLSVLSSNRHGITLRLHAGSGATVSELADALRGALRDLDKQGLGLKQ
jgi:ParB family chromosome partitioning protein